MSQQRQLPPEIQKMIDQYQAIRENYVNLNVELKAIESELVDIDHLLNILKGLNENAELYKLVGHVLIKMSRDEIVRELEERREILVLKKDKYSKQLEIISKQLKEFEDKIRESLSKYGITIG
ncbi:MAG: prefoldin subunit beta [Desulfurococcaceae archaeon]|uniref:Prefoldin subunit beta n=1 Tax=Staphylothermus marinus TaxID=2280 RepID=A0A7C4JM91_STAMA